MLFLYFLHYSSGEVWSCGSWLYFIILYFLHYSSGGMCSCSSWLYFIILYFLHYSSWEICSCISWLYFINLYFYITAPGRYVLAKSGWFWGIWISFLIIIIGIVIFFVLKRVTDRWFDRKGETIFFKTGPLWSLNG